MTVTKYWYITFAHEGAVCLRHDGWTTTIDKRAPYRYDVTIFCSRDAAVRAKNEYWPQNDYTDKYRKKFKIVKVTRRGA